MPIPSAIVNACRYTPTAGGTTDWTFSAAVVGYSTPTLAGVVNGAQYSYRAESADLSQWEIGVGLYNTGTGVLTRLYVNANSSGSGIGPGQSGVGTKISFTAAPTVTLTALVEDLVDYAKGYLNGLTLSAAGATATFGVAAGEASDRLSPSVMVLPSAFTKTTAAWAVGTGNGGLDTGAISAAAWYHVYLIKRPDTNVVDILVSLSATAPTMPSNYTLFRRIGSMRTASSQWIKFLQFGDEFLWDAPVSDASLVTLGTTAALKVLTVPLGVQVFASIEALATATAIGAGLLVTCPNVSTQVYNTPSGNATCYSPVASQQSVVGYAKVLTDTSSQVRVVGTSATANQYSIATRGWTDTRGRV